MAKRAWHLDGCRRGEDGEFVTIHWKLWVADDAGATLRWEVRRIFPSIGFVERNRHTAPRAILDRDLTQWQARWFLFGWIVPECFGRSQHALRCAGAGLDGLQEAEQEAWVSTRALLAVLFHYMQARRAMAARSLVRCVTQLFLESCCTLPFLQGLDLRTIAPVHRGLCAESVVGGLCGCAHAWLDSNRIIDANDAWATAVSVLLDLQALAHCNTLQSHMGKLLSLLGRHINETVDSWGNADLVQWDHAELHGPLKRRRLDPHLRSQVAEATNSHSIGVGCVQALRALGRMTHSQQAFVEEQGLCHMMAATHLACQTKSTISSCFDASRVGVPANDFLAHVLWLRGVGAAVLPPVVPCLCTVCLSCRWCL